MPNLCSFLNLQIHWCNVGCNWHVRPFSPRICNKILCPGDHAKHVFATFYIKYFKRTKRKTEQWNSSYHLSLQEQVQRIPKIKFLCNCKEGEKFLVECTFQLSRDLNHICDGTIDLQMPWRNYSCRKSLQLLKASNQLSIVLSAAALVLISCLPRRNEIEHNYLLNLTHLYLWTVQFSSV